MNEETISKIREFNRFYMPAMDLLGTHYLGSEYSVTEARVFFEVYSREGCCASHIAGVMNIDKSYLSRIMSRHEKDGFLYRVPSERDARVQEIYLTEKGVRAAEDFIRKSIRQIGELLQPLSREDCRELQEALEQAMRILRKCAPENEGGTVS